MFDPYKPVGLEASIGALQKLPTLPGQKKRPVRQAQQKKPSDDDAGIQDARRDMLLDKPKIRETKPGPGDDQMELDPSSDFPIPSSPHQNSPGDDIMQGPLFSHGVRQAAAPAEVRSAIERAAAEARVSPAYALAVAGRESNFDPNAKASKSIFGLFQMSGDLRKRYGSGDSADPYDQAKAFMAFTKDLRDDVGAGLGREPTDPETYLGHHFGAARAARVIARTPPDTPVSDIFTPNEMAQNPHFAQAGTAGALTKSITADIEKRLGQHQQPSREDFAKFGQPGTPPERFGNESRQGFGEGVSMNTSTPEQAAAYDRDFQAQDRFAGLPKSPNVEDRRQDGALSRAARGFADFGRTYVDNVKGAVGLGDDGQPPENEFTRAIPKAVEADKTRPLKSYENVLPTLPALPGGQDFASFGKPSQPLQDEAAPMQFGGAPALSTDDISPEVRNAPYVAQAPKDIHEISPTHRTELPQLDEMAFRQWVKQNNVQFDPDAAKSDYDMRGFYRALQQQDPRAVSGINPNDGILHYRDTWKTPSHPGFSDDSQYAGPVAPKWTPTEKLVSPGGRVLLNERKDPVGGDFAAFGKPSDDLGLTP